MANISKEALNEIIDNIIMSTNPDDYSGHDKFIQYLDDPEICGFGNWQFANGFNMAIVTLRVELKRRGFDV